MEELTVKSDGRVWACMVRLHDLALGWLWENGAQRVWLTTDPQSKAAHFYERRGWRAAGTAERGDTRFDRWVSFEESVEPAVWTLGLCVER